MKKGKAFILVGHSNWGKSETLKALTNGSTHKGRIRIRLKEFFIRRMSNCDIPNSFEKFIKRINHSHYPLLIITLCPDFKNPLKKTEFFIQELYNKY